MRRLSVFIEMSGESVYAGEIAGKDSNDTSFEKAASYVGIGSKMAMKRFDTMVNGFVDAINRAKEELKDQGFDQVGPIGEIMIEKGGIKREINNAK